MSRAVPAWMAYVSKGFLAIVTVASGVGFADAPAESPAPKTFGLLYDGRMGYTDNGFEKNPGEAKPRSTVAFTNNACVSVTLPAADQVVGNAYINLMAPDMPTAIELATVQKTFNNGVMVTVGKNYANYGGYDYKNFIYNALTVSPYTQYNLPINGDQPMVIVSKDFGVAGNFALTFTNDIVKTANNNAFNKVNGQPATLLEWTGTFGVAAPLVQIVPYDGGHSLHTAFGVKFDVHGVVAYVDYVMDSRAANINGKTKKTVYSSYDADITYNAGMVSPFLKFGAFSAKQPDSDTKGNSPGFDSTGAVTHETYDDNGTSWNIGVKLNQFGGTFVPYLAYVGRSSTLLKDATMPAGSTESRSSATFVLGAQGVIN